MGTERAGPAPRSGRVRGRIGAGYLAGCDGARSTIRDSLRIGFPGGTCAHVFYVADVEAKGPLINHELHAALDDADFLAVFPMKGEERARLIGTVRWELDERREALTWDDVGKGVLIACA